MSQQPTVPRSQNQLRADHYSSSTYNLDRYGNLRAFTRESISPSNFPFPISHVALTKTLVTVWFAHSFLHKRCASVTFVSDIGPFCSFLLLYLAIPYPRDRGTNRWNNSLDFANPILSPWTDILLRKSYKIAGFLSLISSSHREIFPVAVRRSTRTTFAPPPSCRLPITHPFTVHHTGAPWDNILFCFKSLTFKGCPWFELGEPKIRFDPLRLGRLLHRP